MSYEYGLLKRTRDNEEKAILESGGQTARLLRKGNKCWCQECGKRISLKRLHSRHAYLCKECDWK